MAAAWTAVGLFIAAIATLKFSRWHKVYGQDPLRLYDMLAIAVMCMSMAGLFVVRLIQ